VLYELAIDTQQRRDPKVVAALEALRRGQAQAPDDLRTAWTVLVPDIRDDELLRLLWDSWKYSYAETAEALVGYARECLAKLRERSLYPAPAAPTVVSVDLEAHEASEGDEAEKADENWEQLCTNVRAAAERLWRNYFLPTDATAAKSMRRTVGRRARGATDQGRLEARARRFAYLAHMARVLLRVWLEASLFRLRAVRNFGAVDERAGFRYDVGAVVPSGQGLERQIAAICAAYRRTLQQWDREVAHAGLAGPFRESTGDASHLRLLSQLFGTSQAAPAERGWLGEAEGAEHALRRELSRVEQILRRRHRHYVAWFLRGISQNPVRSAAAVTALVLTYAAAYFASDLAGACNMATLSWAALLQHLDMAVINLVASGGSTPLPCGPLTGILQASEAVIGYLLLGILIGVVVDAVQGDGRGEI
jgi:hypothetical protein